MSKKKRICEICKQREATIKVVKVINGKRQIAWVCKKCEMKSGIKDQLAGKERKSNTVSKDIFCPECLMSLTEFRRSLKLGCPKCYDVFSGELEKVALKIHGATNHSVRKNFKLDLSGFGIKELQRQIDKAVKREDFELAAKLRDRIKRMRADDRRAI